MILTLLNQWKYSHTGSWSLLLGFTSQCFSVLAQILLTLLFTLIAQGWTINFTNISELELFYPLTGFVVLVNLVLVGVERFTEDSLTSWHNYDSAAGLFLTLIRVGLFGFFVYSLKATIDHKSTKARLRQFLIHFGLLGTVYFLTFPVLVLVNVIVAPYL